MDINQTSLGDYFTVCAVLSHVRLCVTSWTVAHQASLSMEILQERIIEWVSMLSSRRSSQPRDRTHISSIAGGFLTIWATREVIHNSSSNKFTNQRQKLGLSTWELGKLLNWDAEDGSQGATWSSSWGESKKERFFNLDMFQLVKSGKGTERHSSIETCNWHYQEPALNSRHD